MPIYTYQCNNCGVRFERKQSFTDKPLTKCPECEKKALKKVFTPAGIVFKGSGWYATDHRSSSGGASSKSSSGGEGGENSKGSESKKPEAKPEAKTEKASKPSSSDD